MIYILFIIAVLSSMLSQLPIFLDSSIGLLMKATWVPPFLFLLFKYPKTFVDCNLYFVYCFILLFYLYCFICEAFFMNSYMGSDTYNIALSLFIMIISFSFWKHYGNKKILYYLSSLIVLCALFVSLFIYINNNLMSSVDSRMYAYAAKNSMGQLLLASIVVGLVCINNRFPIMKVLNLGILIIIGIVMLLLKSRATLLGFVFVIMYYVIYCIHNRKYQIVLFFSFSLIIYYILYDDNLYTKVVEGLILSGRDLTDLNDVSSGRLVLIDRYLNYINENPIFGKGVDYMDCFPIIIIVQYGVIGAGVIFYFIWNLFTRINISKKYNNEVSLSTYLLFIAYMINSLFEARTPFGPGAKCFLLWMMVGFCIAELSYCKTTYNLKCINNMKRV